MNDTRMGVRLVGPLATHAEGFRLWLSEHCYAASTATDQLRLMAHVSRWLASQVLDCSSLTDEVAGEFLRARRMAGYRNLLSPWALAGLRPRSARCRPRLHDLRHTFAVSTVLDWYRSGVDDVQAKMPQLSTYLGHVDPSSTYWYLSTAPELMALACARLEQNEPQP
jgi:integrase